MTGNKPINQFQRHIPAAAVREPLCSLAWAAYAIRQV